MTDSERIAALEERVAELQQLVAVGAWLHNELVHQLQTLIATQLGPQTHNPAVIARAKRLAALRSKL